MGIGGETNGTFGEGGGGGLGIGLRFDGGLDGGLGLGFDGGLGVGLRFDGGLGLRFDGGTRVIYMDSVTLTLTLTEPLYPSFEHVVWDMRERVRTTYDSIFQSPVGKKGSALVPLEN